MTEASSALLGVWRLDENDVAARGRFGDVSLHFGPNGSLRYVISGRDKDEVILLRFRVDNETIVTDQPSSPREERTPFALTDDGALVLQYGDQRVRYLRQPSARDN